MKIYLLCFRNAIRATEVEGLCRHAVGLVTSDVLEKQVALHTDLPLETQGSLLGERAVPLTREPERGRHAFDAPAIGDLLRPRELEVGTISGPRETSRSCRQCEADYR